MNRLLYTTIIVGLLVSCKNANQKASPTAEQISIDGASAVKPSLSFDKTSHDFGNITAGQKVTHKFKFTNTSSKPATISSVTPTCGCTISKYPRKPLHPGEKGEIAIIFDSSGKMGVENNLITITLEGDQNVVELFITGTVSKAKI